MKTTRFNRPRSLAVLVALVMNSALPAQTVSIGSRLELFVDHFLIDKMEGVQLQAGRPQKEEIVFRFDQPWEEANGMLSVLKDGDTYRMYYRGGVPSGPATSSEITCYAESKDGIHWVRPNLGMNEFRGSKQNNIILPADFPHRATSNFAPFLDSRPGVPADERFKAVGGLYNDNSNTVTDPKKMSVSGGLYRYVSGDGIHWRPYSNDPLFVGYALDTLNVLEWLPEEQVYAIYLRTWSEGGAPDRPVYKGFRTISRSTSKDFVKWSKPVTMTFGDRPMNHLYTNGTHPYFRAPHILIALPFRFSPERQVLSDQELTTFGVRESQRNGTSDTVLMTSRGGERYDRTFMESFIRPGLDRRNWHARNNKAAKGVVPTGDNEMSIYITTHNTLPTSHVTRYSLPVDRFASVHAPYAEGKLQTKPMIFAGERLLLNYSTSAAGSIRVELLDEAGRSLPGYSAADCDTVIGDEIERPVTWKGRGDLKAFSNRPVRLRFLMVDADLYALRFAPASAK